MFYYRSLWVVCIMTLLLSCSTDNKDVGMNENQLEMISIADEAIKNRFLASVNKFIKMNSEATRTDFVDVEITMDSVDKTKHSIYN